MAYNWTGWYVGGNAGYGWGRNTGDLWDLFTDPGGVAGLAAYFTVLYRANVLPGVKPDGIVGGAQIGYNWQTASWVLGLVADIQASGMRGSASTTVIPITGAATSIQSNTSKIDWFGTVRGRVGYVYNNWLLYGTGGLA